MTFVVYPMNLFMQTIPSVFQYSNLFTLFRLSGASVRFSEEQFSTYSHLRIMEGKRVPRQ